MPLNKGAAFVMGVMGDFTGQQDPDKPLPKLKDRKFVNIDLDNFDEVLSGMAPRASFRVKNKLSEDGGEFAVNLQFNKMEDFRPESVAQQVEPFASCSKLAPSFPTCVTSWRAMTSSKMFWLKFSTTPRS